MKVIRVLPVVGVLAALPALAKHEPAPPARPEPVAAGDSFHCAVGDGVSCWGKAGAAPGDDPRGEPGTPIAGTYGATQVTAGPDHACALADGHVHCWGHGEHGELGDGKRTTSEQAVDVALDGVVDVSAGGEHTCAVTADGHVWCWGENGHGQLGTPGWDDAAAPKRVPGVARMVAVRAGRDFTCALRDDGDVWCWGADVTGRGGVGTIRVDPAPVGVSHATSLDAGFASACAVLDDGSVTCWGRTGPYGRPGGPVPVDGLIGAKAVTVGWEHACAIREDGTVACWGRGEFGRLGNGACEDATKPVVVAGLVDVKAVDASATHTCAVDEDGGVWCWGGEWGARVTEHQTAATCDEQAARPSRARTEVAAASRAGQPGAAVAR